MSTLIPYALTVACTWAWGEWSYRVGYRAGLRAERPQQLAEPGTDLGRPTTLAEVPRDRAWQPAGGAGAGCVEGWGDTPPGPPPDRPETSAEPGGDAPRTDNTPEPAHPARRRAMPAQWPNVTSYPFPPEREPTCGVDWQQEVTGGCCPHQRSC